jgi:single-stranded-DNA-specific exonuclease
MQSSASSSSPSTAPEIRLRHAPADAVERLRSAGVHPLLATLFAARGLKTPEEIETALASLLPPSAMKNIEQAAASLAQAITQNQSLLVVADFDADGATACAVAVRGLRRFGAQVDFLVPDRFVFGYGLTPALVDHAVTAAGVKKPDWIITVDNGISSVAGVDRAKSYGVKVLVTDHHLPGQQLPDALIVNPNQPGCNFPSKHLAGVGVMFYVLMALRSHLREQHHWSAAQCPRLDDLLPIVALGTVADVVKLDANNRRLVAQGLTRLRRGNSFAGINALFTVAGVDVRQATPSTLGFSIGPRINAAGRLSDMSIGIRCLLEDDPARAAEIAQELDRLNKERREIEAQARADALVQANDLIVDRGLSIHDRLSLILHDASWHQGVVGLIAGKLKEHFHRPTIIFASDSQTPDQLKGSGRSIPGVHLRDVLERIDTLHPGLLRAFGGHAMAAGMTIAQQDFARFCELFEDTVADFADPSDLQQVLEVDGALETQFLRLDVASMLSDQVWGQGFPPPLFVNTFHVISQRRLKEKHLKLTLALPGSATPQSQRIEAIWFNAAADLPSSASLAFRLGANTWQGVTQLQLEVVAALPLA